MFDFLGNFNILEIGAGIVGLGAIGFAIDYVLKNAWKLFFKKEVILKQATDLNNWLEKLKKDKPETAKQIEADLIEIFQKSIEILKT